MDSLELMRNSMKHAATINGMSKQVEFDRRQFQRLSKRADVISFAVERLINSTPNRDKMKPMLDNLHDILEKVVKLIRKCLEASVFERYMNNYQYQEQLRTFNDLLMCNCVDLALPLDVHQLFDEAEDLADQYGDLNEVSSNIDELGLKLAQHHQQSFDTFEFTKEEFYRHADSFKFHLQQDIQKARDSQLAKNIQNERQCFLHISGYDLLQQERIGQGAFGDVYRGKWLSRHHDVAIKVIRVTHVTDAVKQGFLKEIATMYKIRYEHVISVLGACMESNYCALVMEYMSLGSLSDFLQQKEQTLSWPIRISLVLQMTKSINYLHMMSILHRDIKSSNFLIERASNGFLVKVTDFSLAQIRSESSQQSLRSASGRLPQGTLRWTAPELFSGASSSTASDVYSLAVVFWEVATRSIPYGDTSDVIIVNIVLAGNRPSIPVDVPPSVAAIISDSWNQEPGRRPTCQELIQRIETNVSTGQYENEATQHSRSYPLTDTWIPSQISAPHTTPYRTGTSPTSFGWKEEIFSTAENKHQHQSTISAQNIDRSTISREASEIEDDQAHRVTLAIHDLMLYDNCPIYDDDDYTNIFISINFLDYPPEELETPGGLPKKRPFTRYSFNFQKDYSVRRPEQQAQLAQLIALHSSGEIRFDVVAEPSHHKQTLECIDVGYATVNVKQLLRTDNDYIKQSTDVISANKKKEIVGQMGITILIVQALKLAQKLKQPCHPIQKSDDTSRTTVTSSQPQSSQFPIASADNNQLQDTDSNLVARYTELRLSSENEARPASRWGPVVCPIFVSDNSTRASRLRIAAIRARMDANSNPRRHRAGAKIHNRRPPTPGRPK